MYRIRNAETAALSTAQSNATPTLIRRRPTLADFVVESTEETVVLAHEPCNTVVTHYLVEMVRLDELLHDAHRHRCASPSTRR